MSRTRSDLDALLGKVDQEKVLIMQYVVNYAVCCLLDRTGNVTLFRKFCSFVMQNNILGTFI